MTLLLVLIIYILIIGLFLYSKLLPYKDKLTGRYKTIFEAFNSIFSPIFNLLKGAFKPFQVGIGLSVDMTQIVLLFILLILLHFVR